MIAPIKMNLNRIVRLEDSRLKDIDSVDAYISELEWVNNLIEYHRNRCLIWKMENPACKEAYGKPNDFLETLEE